LSQAFGQAGLRDFWGDFRGETAVMFVTPVPCTSSLPVLIDLLADGLEPFGPLFSQVTGLAAQLTR
jgi:hypothetical protein